MNCDRTYLLTRISSVPQDVIPLQLFSWHLCFLKSTEIWPAFVNLLASLYLLEITILKHPNGRLFRDNCRIA